MIRGFLNIGEVDVLYCNFNKIFLYSLTYHLHKQVVKYSLEGTNYIYSLDSVMFSVFINNYNH